MDEEAVYVPMLGEILDGFNVNRRTFLVHRDMSPTITHMTYSGSLKITRSGGVIPISSVSHASVTIPTSLGPIMPSY